MNEHEQVNILMVDDQPGKLLSYEVILAELGENLIKAHSGKEALEQLLRFDIAVVLMDVSMPDLDGFELADIIRQHPRFENTAIIFISAVHMSDVDRLNGYQRGAVDYISVPIIPELLRAKVSVFADLHRKNLLLARLNRELESRVAERTEELEKRTQVLEQVNVELAKKHQELDAIVRTAPDIIFSRQPDGSRNYISERFYEYTGAMEGTASGFGWGDYVHPDDRERSREEWMESVRSGKNYESEYRICSKDGEYRWFRARAVPIHDREGAVLMWYGTCSDIHDSKLLERSIRDSATELERMVDVRTAELRRLSGRLLTMQDDERRRMARELHDGLGQELVAAKLMIEMIPRQIPGDRELLASQASETINRAIQQVRSMSHLLHPPLLDEVGLLSALRWYSEGLSSRSGIETLLEVQPSDFPRLTPELETAIFRIIQEALTNVFRHADAKKGWITLTLTDGHIVVAVRDDGKGIAGQIEALDPGSIGIGLGGMSQRAKELGGRLRVRNASPGTLLEVTIPCANGNSQEARTAV